MIMKKRTFLLMMSSLFVVGCTKTIQIDNRPMVTTAPSSNPIVYDEVVNYEPMPQVQPIVPVQATPQIQQEPQSVSPISRQINISPLEALDRLREDDNVMLLDVRTPEEIPVDGKIANSTLMPLGSLSRNSYRLDKSKQIIVYCHTGSRSAEATKILRGQGFDALNMLGGIEAWKQNHLHVVWK